MIEVETPSSLSDKEIEALTHSLELLSQLNVNSKTQYAEIEQNPHNLTMGAKPLSYNSEPESHNSSRESPSNSRVDLPVDSNQDFSPQASSSSSLADNYKNEQEAQVPESVRGLLPHISEDEVEWSAVDVTNAHPKLRDIRSLLIDHFPILNSPPEETKSKTKPRRPLAPPPALLPKSKIVSIQEKEAREKSLVVRLERVEEREVVKALITCETRRFRWKHYGQASKDETFASMDTTIDKIKSPWDVSLDTSVMTRTERHKKSFAIKDQFRTSTCLTCQGVGKILCPRCSGVESDECFWCDGTGIKKGNKQCDVCQGARKYQCAQCCNGGKITCNDCNGNGNARLQLHVIVKMRHIELPPIRIEALVKEEYINTEAELRSRATKKVLQVAKGLQSNTHGILSVPIKARCLLEKSITRFYSVIRPLHSDWKGIGYTDGTPDIATGFEIDASSTRSLNSLFSFEGVDPKTQVETYEFKVSSVPCSVPVDITSQSCKSTYTSPSTSRQASPLQSPRINPSMAHDKQKTVTPRTSVANLQTLFKQVERRQSFTRGSPFPESEGHTESSGFQYLDPFTINFMQAVQHQQRLHSNSSARLAGKYTLPKLFTRTKSHSERLNKLSSLSTNEGPLKPATAPTSPTY